MDDNEGQNSNEEDTQKTPRPSVSSRGDNLSRYLDDEAEASGADDEEEGSGDESSRGSLAAFVVDEDENEDTQSVDLLSSGSDQATAPANNDDALVRGLQERAQALGYRDDDDDLQSEDEDEGQTLQGDDDASLTQTDGGQLGLRSREVLDTFARAKQAASTRLHREAAYFEETEVKGDMYGGFSPYFAYGFSNNLNHRKAVLEQARRRLAVARHAPTSMCNGPTFGVFASI
jgi:hypothetical protein